MRRVAAIWLALAPLPVWAEDPRGPASDIAPVWFGTGQESPLDKGSDEAAELELAAFPSAVAACWNVRPDDEVRVTVLVSFTEDGRVDDQIRLLSADGGTEADRDAAFDAARRAILACQGEGYPLPPALYDRWREMALTFDPSRMQTR